MSSNDPETTSDDLKLHVIDKPELCTFLQGKKGSERIILPLVMEKKCTDFSMELEDMYFKPGTAANADFILIMSPPSFS